MSGWNWGAVLIAMALGWIDPGWGWAFVGGYAVGMFCMYRDKDARDAARCVEAVESQEGEYES